MDVEPYPRKYNTGDCVISDISAKNSLGRLSQAGWLSEQPDEFREWAARVARSRSFKSGQYLYMAGDAPDGLYGLKSGSVEIEFPLIADAPVSLLRKNEGFWIGDSALLSKTERIISIVAVQDCDFAYLPGAAIKHLLTEDPKHWHSFYDLSARNTLLAVKLLAESLSLTVRARVCRTLLSLSENRVEAQITQEALAKTLGIARPTLRRCLVDLTALGAIKAGYRKIRLLDKDLLKGFEDEQ